MKFNLFFKQTFVAMGFLLSMVLTGQANAVAVSSEVENAELGKIGAIALTGSSKNWQNTDNSTPVAEAVPEAPVTTEPSETIEPLTVEPSTTESLETPEAPVTVESSETMEAPAESTQVQPLVETGVGIENEAPAADAIAAPAPFVLDEDSAAAEDLAPTTAQDPPSLAPRENNTLELFQTQDGTEIAQGVETRYRFNYIGIGPNIGITGSSAIGDFSGAIVSRISVTPQFSARPAVFIEDDVSILLPVTYDFPIAGVGEVAPYVGGGLVINTGDDSAVDLLLSAGLDFPFDDNFALTAGINAAPFDEFDLGAHVAIAYTFGAVTTTEEPLDLGAVGAEVEGTASELGLESRRANPSFIGIGANLGIGGDTALGDTSFAILSKITIAPSISVRPSLLIEDGVTLLIPATYDFDGFSTEFISFYPFIGAGAAVSFDDESDFDLLLTAGVDVPITSNLAFTSSINAGLFDSFDIGVLLGIVYTFSSF